VGKAKDLKKRVASYFQRPNHDPKTESLTQAASDLDFIVTNTEVEALLLENTLIKKHWPRYNIKLKDSSSYACIHLTDERFPRIRISRDKVGRGTFFGLCIFKRKRITSSGSVLKTLGPWLQRSSEASLPEIPPERPAAAVHREGHRESTGRK
jgi:excinuclease UvrABC nuclease subunit